jgi:hypothetical protein
MMNKEIFDFVDLHIPTQLLLLLLAISTTPRWKVVLLLGWIIRGTTIHEFVLKGIAADPAVIARVVNPSN